MVHVTRWLEGTHWFELLRLPVALLNIVHRRAINTVVQCRTIDTVVETVDAIGTAGLFAQRNTVGRSVPDQSIVRAHSIDGGACSPGDQVMRLSHTGRRLIAIDAIHTVER